MSHDKPRTRAVDESALTHLSVRSVRKRFRRCGIEFTDVPRAYPASDLGTEAVTRLEGEAELVTRRVSEEEADRINADAGIPSDMTLADAKERIAELENELATLKRRQGVGIRERVAREQPAAAPPGSENVQK